MVDPEVYFKAIRELNLDFFSGVPDSLLKNFCGYLADNLNGKQHIIAANEGAAVGLGIGYHLATNKVPCVYLQNSGLGNAVNPLLSLVDQAVCSIPMLLFIGWRGEPGIPDEPQHKKQGEVTLSMLESMGINYDVLDSETTSEQAVESLKLATEKCEKNKVPFAIVVRKNSFSPYAMTNRANNACAMTMQAGIRALMSVMNSQDLVIATTGVCSRELFDYRQETGQTQHGDFLTVGGMGHASQIALGVAIQQPEQTVYCLDGDGALLMHCGSMAINAQANATNFKHIVFNNFAHNSVGGQPTAMHNVNLAEVAQGMGYSFYQCVDNPTEIADALGALRNCDGVGMLEIRVKQGVRSPLPRPDKTPVQNKLNVMKFLNQTGPDT